MSQCAHVRTEIWEPHLAGARKCLDCGQVYNPNCTPNWFYEESPVSQISQLTAKIERLETEKKNIQAEFDKFAYEKGFEIGEFMRVKNNRLAEVETALKDIIELIERNDLVRNIENDRDILEFMHQGSRIVNGLQKAFSLFPPQRK